MDLPKGLVKDDRRIYEDVASLTQPLPSEFIIRMWRLYTTTNLKLVDPTARRLENLWWHVMGSDRCKLKAATVAKIWEHISYGPTFVPLRGSPNRWEGPSTPRFNSQHESDPLLSAQQMNQDIKMISEQSALKELSASSSRPPPPHPILKKNRGDSKSGPRPTARFVSPHESTDEDYKTSEGTSSGSTAASGLEMRISSVVSPTKANRKKAPVPTKRFVASAANKRRPILPRRMSSQSSTGSDVMAKEIGSANGTKHVGTYNVTPVHAEQSTAQSVLGSPGIEPPPSAKATAEIDCRSSRSASACACAAKQIYRRTTWTRGKQGEKRRPQDTYEHLSCIASVFITTDRVFLIFALYVLGPSHGANKLQFGNVSAARSQYRSRFCKRAALERYGKHVEHRGHGSHLDIRRTRPACFGSLGNLSRGARGYPSANFVVVPFRTNHAELYSRRAAGPYEKPADSAPGAGERAHWRQAETEAVRRTVKSAIFSIII
ncbi:hypothetical protein CTA2_11453 [Colletotrichum tanaceti]|nr:hypothetical protein CTA2_11453 [Colletotrichum tanaceti]